MNHHGLDGWSLVIDNKSKRRAGVCKYSKKQIGLTLDYALKTSPDDLEQTIIHEIAHAPESGNYKNELIDELASHYNALAMHAGLEARAYQGSQHQELTGEDWEDRSELIRFETA